MRLIIALVLAGFSLGCNNANLHHNRFAEFANSETVAIYLSNYNLDTVPPDIAVLKEAKRLYIAKDSMGGGWTILPPLSAIRLWAEKPPFRHLPMEITKLKNLRSLGLYRLDLVDLPENFDELENLDTLTLTMNKLTISNELQVLKNLKNLKYLELLGNKVDTSDIAALKAAIPQLVVISDIQD